MHYLILLIKIISVSDSSILFSSIGDSGVCGGGEVEYLIIHKS